MLNLKIVLIGPCKCGKTSIANILSDSTDNVGSEYRPTKGVRIVEFETHNTNNRSLKAEVELWDCSGDFKYESLWPAMYKDAHGIVFVYDPTSKNSVEKLDHYFDSFLIQSNSMSVINERNCLIIAHLKSSESKIKISPLSEKFSKIQLITVNSEENSQKLQNDFSKYVTSLLSGVRDRNEQDELNILTIT